MIQAIIPPNSKESEMMVLGCMLTSINALNSCAEVLDETDFYYQEHQIIVSALKGAYKADKPADIHIIAEDLKRVNKLDCIGGINYLTLLAQYAGTSAYIEEYIDLVKEKSTLRRMLAVGQQIVKTTLEGPSDVGTALDEAVNKLLTIRAPSKRSPVKLGDSLPGVIDELLLKQADFESTKQEKISGVSTGFRQLDDILDGLLPGDLDILAARTGMGKSWFALNLAVNMAQLGIPILYVSLEMSTGILLNRLLSMLSDVSPKSIRRGTMSRGDLSRVQDVSTALLKLPLYITDNPENGIADVSLRTMKQMVDNHQIRVIFVDHLNLISIGRSGKIPRYEEVGQISRKFKLFAESTSTTVLGLAQLNRDADAKEIPSLSHLRESGALEQDSSVVLILHRREKYDPYDKPGIAQLRIAKNRHGEDNCDLEFDRKGWRFKELPPIEQFMKKAHAATSSTSQSQKLHTKLP